MINLTKVAITTANILFHKQAKCINSFRATNVRGSQLASPAASYLIPRTQRTLRENKCFGIFFWL